MLDSIFNQGVLTIGKVLLVLGLAVVLGLIASVLYIKQNKNVTKSFAFTLVILPLITSTVIMVVNGNLGAGIAVAGSFSLIRFRSAQGTGQEILAVFLSAALGLCLGAGYVAVACLLLMIYAAAMILLRLVHFGNGLDAQRELRISVPEALDYEGLFDDILNAHFISYELEKVRTIEMGTAYQLVYRVKSGNNQPGKQFLDAVRTRNGNLPVSLGRIPEARNEM